MFIILYIIFLAKQMYLKYFQFTRYFLTKTIGGVDKMKENEWNQHVEQLTFEYEAAAQNSLVEDRRYWDEKRRAFGKMLMGLVDLWEYLSEKDQKEARREFFELQRKTLYDQHITNVMLIRTKYQIRGP